MFTVFNEGASFIRNFACSNYAKSDANIQSVTVKCWNEGLYVAQAPRSKSRNKMYTRQNSNNIISTPQT